MARRCCPNLDDLLTPKLFKALGDPTRVALLSKLAAACGPCTVSEVAKSFSVDLSVISRHLGILREAGVLTAERRGKEVHHTVRYDALARTLRELADAIEACCPAPEQEARATDTGGRDR